MLEAHDTGEEVLIFNQNAVIAVAPPCKESKPPSESIEAFFVPKHTMIKYNIGVWHYAPFLPDTSLVKAFYCAPLRVYVYDEIPVKLNPDECVEIVW